MIWAVGVLSVPALVVAYLLFCALFERGLAYRLDAPPPPLDGEAFLCALGALCHAPARHAASIELLRDGADYYEAQLAAIAGAWQSVHLEQFLVDDGKVTDRFVATLAERARAGVAVRVVLDWIGARNAKDETFAPVREAGGAVLYYEPPRWYTLRHFSNRTHRKLLVVDGELAFVGGAGLSDRWLDGGGGEPTWRDAMFRLRGDVVTALQGTFASNWLEASERVLPSRGCLPDHGAAGGDGVPALVVETSPQEGRSSRAHVLYQLLVAGARESIAIVTPYFLPDSAMRRELVAALRRGVRVTILTAGPYTDYKIALVLGRWQYDELLDAGAAIYEYQPAMMHMKALVVDGLWSVIGSANLDRRSMGINDEINVAVRDPGLAAELHRSIATDLASSRRYTIEDWRKRPLRERAVEPLARILDRQS